MISLSKPVATHHARAYTLYGESGSEPFHGTIHTLPDAALIEARYDATPRHRADWQQSYGPRLRTRFSLVLRHRDGSTRVHPVWCVNYSNSGSLYVRFENQDCYLGITAEYGLTATRDAAYTNVS